jgi:hypothetical protein
MICHIVSIGLWPAVAQIKFSTKIKKLEHLSSHEIQYEYSTLLFIAQNCSLWLRVLEASFHLQLPQQQYHNGSSKLLSSPTSV